MGIKTEETTSRRTGEAMEAMVKIFSNKQKTGNAKQVLFILTRGRTFGCVYKLQNAAKELNKLGVKVYVLAFGTRLIMEELTMMTKPDRIFRATKYEHLVKGNSESPAIIQRIAQRVIRCE